MTHSSQEWRAGQSGQRLKPGLYIVATPIGNLRDITMRALDILHAAETVYCEDTRVAQRLLSVFGIKANLERCDEHTEQRRISEVANAIRDGKIVAYISDAGTPGISDPGSVLVRACHDQGLHVSPVPGACAAIAAVSVAGLDVGTPVVFLGFLPQKSGARRKILTQWQPMGAALILYEAPQRVADVLQDIQAMMGEPTVMIARELTKLHETFYRGTPSELLPQIDNADFRGEVAMVLFPAATHETEWNDTRIDDELRNLMQSLSLKEAVAQVTALSGLSRKQVYARALALDKK